MTCIIKVLHNMVSSVYSGRVIIWPKKAWYGITYANPLKINATYCIVVILNKREERSLGLTLWFSLFLNVSNPFPETFDNPFILKLTRFCSPFLNQIYRRWQNTFKKRGYGETIEWFWALFSVFEYEIFIFSSGPKSLLGAVLWWMCSIQVESLTPIHFILQNIPEISFEFQWAKWVFVMMPPAKLDFH